MPKQGLECETLGWNKKGLQNLIRPFFFYRYVPKSNTKLMQAKAVLLVTFRHYSMLQWFNLNLYCCTHGKVANHLSPTLFRVAFSQCNVQRNFTNYVSLNNAITNVSCSWIENSEEKDIITIRMTERDKVTGVKSCRAQQ
jgi:hypothetical protein